MGTADKGKRAKVAVRGDEDDDGGEHPIDGELVFHIERLQEIQDELEKVNEDASDKVLEVEQKYNEIRRPVYQRRNEIIQAIPDFWLTAFLSHPALGELLSEEDQKIFKYIVSLNVDDFKDVKSGYTISFNFSSNPYFEDTKLIKTFSFKDDGTTTITGTPIKWKDNMDIANGDVHEKKGNKRLLSEESFFSWFGETQLKSLSEGDEIAEIIKEDLWPNPLKYFNNEADEEDFDGEDDGEGDDDDEEDDDDDDDDEPDVS